MPFEIPTIPKPLIYLFILTTLIGALTATYHAVFDAGYNKATVEFTKSSQELIINAVEEARATWVSEVKATTVVIEKEAETREVVKTVYKEVYKEVYICEDVGQNVIDLLNRPITASKGVLDES